MLQKDKPAKINDIPFADVLALSAFRSLWFGQICSQLAGNTLLFVLGLRVYQTTGSNTAVSGLFLVYGLAAFFFGMAGGTIVDKFDKRLILMFCDLLRAIGVFGFLLFPGQIIATYFLMFIHATVTQLYVPAEAPTIPRLVPPQYLMAANSLFSFTYFSSLALGSILAGPLLRLFGPTGIFFFLAFLFIIAAINVGKIPKEESLATVFIRLRGMKVDYIVKRVFTNAKAGIEYVLKSKTLCEALMLLAGTQVVLAILGTLGPGFADKMLEIDIRDASLIITGPAVLGILFGALWVGSVGSRINPEDLIKNGILWSGIILLIISFLVRLKFFPIVANLFHEGFLLPIILVLFFLLGVANSFLDVPANSILQKTAVGEMRGRVYGMLTAAVGGIGIFPVVLGGIMADAMGAGSVIFFLGLLIIGLAWYRLRYNKQT